MTLLDTDTFFAASCLTQGHGAVLETDMECIVCGISLMPGWVQSVCMQCLCVVPVSYVLCGLQMLRRPSYCAKHCLPLTRRWQCL